MLLWRQFTRFPMRCSRRESGNVPGNDLGLGCLCTLGREEEEEGEG